MQGLHKCSAREGGITNGVFYSFQMVNLEGEGDFLLFYNKIHFLIQAFYVSFSTQSKCCEHVQRQRSLMCNSPQTLNQGGT